MVKKLILVGIIAVSLLIGSAKISAVEPQDSQAEQLIRRYLEMLHSEDASSNVYTARMEVLGRLKTMPKEAVAAIDCMLPEAKNTQQRYELAGILGEEIQTEEAARLLCKLLKDSDELVRGQVIHGLRLMASRTRYSGSKRIQQGPEFTPKVAGLVPYLISAASDKAERNRISALYALADTRDPLVLSELRNRLKDPSGKVRSYAACFLTEYQDASGLPEMRNALVRLRENGPPSNPSDSFTYYSEAEMLLASLERITGKSFGEIPMNPHLYSVIPETGRPEQRYKELLDTWTEWWAKQDGETFASLGLPEGNRVEILFQSMRDKTYTQGDRFPGFPILYWSDIPDLMKIAESERMLQSYPGNTISSYISREGYPEGMITLWLIEGIHKGSRFPSLNPICFKYGKANTTQEIHIKIYNAYSKWWRAVKDLPKEEAVKVDPLKGTLLDWSGRTDLWQDEGVGVLRFRKSPRSNNLSLWKSYDEELKIMIKLFRTKPKNVLPVIDL